ncbi:unnamed protein product [Rhizophagus irregularis]|nr:unnamed protein product [Rhizophagus irregularis]
MTKSFSKDANILSLEEEEIIKGLDYPVSLFMDTSNEVIKQKYTNSLSKSFMTHESILISGRETLLSKKYDKESTHNKWIEILYKRSKWCLLDSQLYLNQEKVKSKIQWRKHNEPYGAEYGYFQESHDRLSLRSFKEDSRKFIGLIHTLVERIIRQLLVSGNQISNLVDDLDDNIFGELSRFEDY